MPHRNDNHISHPHIAKRIKTLAHILYLQSARGWHNNSTHSLHLSLSLSLLINAKRVQLPLIFPPKICRVKKSNTNLFVTNNSMNIGMYIHDTYTQCNDMHVPLAQEVVLSSKIHLDYVTISVNCLCVGILNELTARNCEIINFVCSFYMSSVVKLRLKKQNEPRKKIHFTLI